MARRGRIEELIDRSSLGEPAVACLRMRTPRSVADAIVARSETLRSPRVESGKSTYYGTEPAKSQPAFSRIREMVGRRNQVSKSTRNSGESWSRADEVQLRQLARENTPTRVIGLKLGRTENAVRSKASELNVSLKPTNQSPYNRRSK
jgi:hypothetical protein